MDLGRWPRTGGAGTGTGRCYRPAPVTAGRVPPSYVRPLRPVGGPRPIGPLLALGGAGLRLGAPHAGHGLDGNLVLVLRGEDDGPALGVQVGDGLAVAALDNCAGGAGDEHP